MAEREERILITKCPGECEHLWYKDADQGFPYGANKPLNNFYCAEEVKDWTKGDRSQKTKLVKPSIDCKNCKKAKYRGMTRQEAINRMAKAICLERHACISKGEMCGLCELWRNFSTHAEAALNALLEGKIMGVKQQVALEVICDCDD